MSYRNEIYWSTAWQAESGVGRETPACQKQCWLHHLCTRLHGLQLPLQSQTCRWSGREELRSAEQLGRSVPASQTAGAAKLPPAAALHVANMQFWRGHFGGMTFPMVGLILALRPGATQGSLYTFMNT